MTAHKHDSDDFCPACREQWGRAGSVSRLRELTARFLEGKLRAQVAGGGATVFPETEGLTAVLAAINRAGFLTRSSQPGSYHDGWVQRAWVSGFATEAVLDTLLAGCLCTDLVVLALPRWIPEGARVCITRLGPRECTWAGSFYDPVDVYEPSGRRLLVELAGLWGVDIIDPVWGRNDLLWTTVHAALTSRRPRQYYEEPF